ncbi:MAG: hypothetical protein ABI760_13680 [Ferruginibacter sp.]
MFLKKVYLQWRSFFWVIIFALIAQFFFMAKGIENIPFFLYHMFSYAHQPKDSFNVILIKTQDGYLDPHELSSRESEMLMNNIPYFNQIKKNAWKDFLIPTVEKRFGNRLPMDIYNHLQGGLVNDSMAFSNYTSWWQRYFKRVYNHSFDSVSVVSGYVHYNPGFSKSPVDSIIFTCRFR